MVLTGAQVIMECLLEQGVDTVFGYPGGFVLNIYDALYEYRDRINHIRTAHEQGAAHAADGYARSSGKTGVCIATSGPGATNLVTGIATAYMDSVPVVAITGNVNLDLLGLDSFQEVDITGITMPITKHNFLVKDVRKLADTIRAAFRIANSGRKGPVLVDIPKDLTAQKVEFLPPAPPEQEKHHLFPFEQRFEQALQMLEKAERPFVYAGGGVIASGASEALKTFAERLDAPVACSLMCQGGFDRTDSRYMGMLGMHGTNTAALAIKNCDLFVAVGTRFSDRVLCNAKSFAQHCPQHTHADWMANIAAWKADYPLSQTASDPNGVTPQEVLETLSDLTNDDAIICTDVGQHQMWAAQFYRFRHPRQFISSGGLGTMGFGLGAALGAQVANPDARVINIAGDGSFHMNCNELATAVAYNIPVMELVFNNSVLGMVRQWQKLFYDNRFSQTDLDKNTDFVKLAEAFGARAFVIQTKADIRPVLEQALALREPVLIDCRIDKDVNVLPMVPAGASVESPILEM